MFLIQSQSKLMLRKASCLIFLTVLLCLLRFKKNAKIHPDFGTPKRCLLSAMCIGCEHHRCKQLSDAECWAYASLAMMKSISIKSAVAKAFFPYP